MWIAPDYPDAACIESGRRLLHPPLALPHTAIGRQLELVPPPPVLFALLAVLVVVYLAVVEAVKQWFYCRLEVPSP